MSVRDVIAATLVEPTASERSEVQALIGAGEAPDCPRPGSEEGGINLLLQLLSADPTEEEPIEDAFGGMVQSLDCAQVF